GPLLLAGARPAGQRSRAACRGALPALVPPGRLAAAAQAIPSNGRDALDIFRPAPLARRLVRAEPAASFSVESLARLPGLAAWPGDRLRGVANDSPGRGLAAAPGPPRRGDRSRRRDPLSSRAHSGGARPARREYPGGPGAG